MVFVPPAQFPHRKKVADVMTTSKALRTRPRHMQKALWETVEPYVFLAPALIIFGLFLYYPFTRTIYLSLFLPDKYGMAKVFWGVGNYTSIFSDPSFWRSLTVTFEFVVMVAVGGLVVGLSPALFFQVIINIIQAFQSFSQVKIIFWHSMGGVNGEAINKMVADFNAANAGKIEVEVQFQGDYDEAINKLKSASMGNMGADVV